MPMLAAAMIHILVVFAALAAEAFATEGVLGTCVQDGQCSDEQVQTSTDNFTATARYTGDYTERIKKIQPINMFVNASDIEKKGASLNDGRSNMWSEVCANRILERMFPGEEMIPETELTRTSVRAKSQDSPGTPDVGFRNKDGQCTYAQVVRARTRSEKALMQVVFGKIIKSLKWLKNLAQLNDEELRAPGPSGFIIFVWVDAWPSALNISKMELTMKEIQKHEASFDLLMFSTESHSSELFPEKFESEPDKTLELENVTEECLKEPSVIKTVSDLGDLFRSVYSSKGKPAGQVHMTPTKEKSPHATDEAYTEPKKPGITDSSGKYFSDTKTNGNPGVRDLSGVSKKLF